MDVEKFPQFTVAELLITVAEVATFHFDSRQGTFYATLNIDFFVKNKGTFWRDNFRFSQPSYSYIYFLSLFVITVAF